MKCSITAARRNLDRCCESERERDGAQQGSCIISIPDPKGFISHQSFELNNEEKLVSEVSYLRDLLTQALVHTIVFFTSFLIQDLRK